MGIEKNDNLEAKSNQFMNFMNDPSQVFNSTKFNVATAATQFFALMFFAIIGASISFRFETFRDILDLNYWITVIVLLVEQLYAYNIGYSLGRSMMINANKELKTTNDQIEMLVEGVYDEKTNEEIVRPLKKDSSYVEPALDVLMNKSKIELVKKRMKEIIEIFNSKLDYFESLNNKRFWFPKRVRVAKHKGKWFWKRSSAMFYCANQINYGKKMLKDEETILAVPDRNVAGFQRLAYVDVISSQSESGNFGVSQYYQRSEAKAKAKAFGRKAIIKLGMALMGSSIFFGAMAGSQTLGMIVYSLFILIIMFASGFKFGSDIVISVILYNAVNRLKAIKDIQRQIPILIKENEKKSTYEPENDVKQDLNTTDILQPINIS